MIHQLKFQVSIVLVVVTLLAAVSVVASPLQKRVVIRLSRPNEPVQVVAIKAKGKTIEFGKPFPGKNNWPGSLSFVIKNISTRSVSWVRVALSFRKARGGLRMDDLVTYGIGRWDIDKLRGGGPPLKPGETAEISYSMDQYQSARELLDGMGFPQSLGEIEVSADQVIFSDQPELMWIEGKMNEFHSPTGWRPVSP